MICHSFDVADKQKDSSSEKQAADKRKPIGPASRAVAANIEALRTYQNLSYAELSRRLERAGQPIPILGLRRIESLDRKVDADDLCAIAAALNVAPITLLMPNVRGGRDPHETVYTSGHKGRLTATRLWDWLRAVEPLGDNQDAFLHFTEMAHPWWELYEVRDTPLPHASVKIEQQGEPRQRKTNQDKVIHDGDD